MKRLVFFALLLALALPAAAQETATITIARVQYGGGGDWYADEESLPQLLTYVREHTLLDVAPQEDVVELTSDKVFTYPYLYLTGHGAVRLNEREIRRLRRYLDGGGFLHVDDNYGLDEHIRRVMQQVYPDQTFVELPFDHPIYHTHFDFPDGLPKIHEHDGKPPQGFGLFDADGRLVVFYTYETDLGDGWEPASIHNNPPEKREAALQMGTNILTYAMMFRVPRGCRGARTCLYAADSPHLRSYPLSLLRSSTMRTPIILAAIAAAFLVLTNPDMDDFRNFVRGQSDVIVQREAGGGALGELAGALAGGLAGRYVDRVTEHRSYFVFSTYTMELDGNPEDEDAWRFLGIGGQFIELERPAALDEDR